MKDNEEDHLEDQDNDWFADEFAAFNIIASMEEDIPLPYCAAMTFPSNDWHNVMKRLYRSDPSITREQDYILRTRIVISYMGSMTLCRGNRGKDLFKAGATEALVETLVEIFTQLPAPTQIVDAESSFDIVIQLAITSWGAIRDLGCGNAEIRAKTRQLGGMKLLADYLRRYHEVPWESIDAIQLKLITSLIGAMRNITHSARENCEELHQYGVSELLIWRLLQGSTTPTIPDVTQPFREASFRTASTLINMAEKSEECASVYASNSKVIAFVVDVTGGKKAPLIHLGLVAILQAAKEKLPKEEYDPDWETILLRENARKHTARKREEQRKTSQTLSTEKGKS